MDILNKNLLVKGKIVLNDIEKQLCVQIVKESIGKHLGVVEKISECPASDIFTSKFGLFVTIKMGGELRGCIGYIKGVKSLYESLIDLSYMAAFQDDRFYPISASEFDFLQIEISILSELYIVTDASDIVVGRDGLYIINPHGCGLLLPQVAAQNSWDTQTFLTQTCKKAGLSSSCLTDPNTQIYRFEAEIFVSG